MLWLSQVFVGARKSMILEHTQIISWTIFDSVIQ